MIAKKMTILKKIFMIKMKIKLYKIFILKNAVLSQFKINKKFLV